MLGAGGAAVHCIHRDSARGQAAAALSVRERALYHRLVFGGLRRRRSRTVLLPRIEQARWDATAAALRARVERRLVQVGEQLGGSQPAATVGDDNKQAVDDYLLALDAYTAAGKVFDEAEGLLDLTGAFVLLDIATGHFNAAVAQSADGNGHGTTTQGGGQQTRKPHKAHKPHRPPIPKRCFQNPLHGPAVHEHEHHRNGNGGTRRSKGRAGDRRGAIQPVVPVCAECLRRVRAKQMPDVLVVPITVKVRRKLITGVPVPYYALSAADSLWVATGFGTLPGFSDADLVAAVLRGEFRPHRASPASRASRAG